jgi:uncharacterized protein
MGVRIGVLSDTHLRSPDARLERILENLFADADMILHAGDIVTRGVLDRLLEAGVIAVAGNMDDYDVLDELPQTRIVEAEGRRIGLIHGWGSRVGLEQRILGRFQDKAVDLVVYGHSHKPFWSVVHGVPMFNPGSASNNSIYGCGTVGVIELLENNMETSIIDLDK